MASKAQRACQKVIRRVRRACEIENCTLGQLFAAAGQQDGLSEREIQETALSYTIALKTHGRVDPPPWFRRYVNQVRKPLARKAKYQHSVERAQAQA